MASGPHSRELKTCFVCSRQAWGLNHNVKDCIQIVDVSLQLDGWLQYIKGTGRPLNTCVKGTHAHQTYEEQLVCATDGDGGFKAIEKFRELEDQGVTPCPRCGDVFPTHPLENCWNYPYLTMGDQGFKAAYDAQTNTVLECLQAVTGKIALEEAADAACPACTESDDHHNWRSCLKRMICRRGAKRSWETEPPQDPKDLSEGYQISPCENCCTIIPNHSIDNCPHPECRNFGAWFALARGESYVALPWVIKRKFLNGITEIDELCPICNWFVMWRNEGVVRYHDSEKCLRNCCIVLKEQGDQWMIKITQEGEEPLPINICAGGQHTHESWQEYRECYSKMQKKYTFPWELHVLRGNKTHELCWLCADIFADHAGVQCPVGPGSERPSLLDFRDDPTGSFVQFIGTMVEHANLTQTGPCPLCSIQEDQHDYATCLRAAKMELRWNVMTSR